MDITFLIAISLIALAALFGLLVSRATIILLILLAGSQVLGLLDQSTIALKGIFDIHALFAIVILLAILASVQKFRDLRSAKLFKPMLIISILWLYGLIYPIALGRSSLFYALEASKEFLMIFSYFGIFLFIRTKREVEQGWYLLIGLGLYYSLLEILVQVFGESLAGLLNYNFRPEGEIFWKIYPPFISVIFLALIHSYFVMTLRTSSKYLSISIAFLGLLLTFYRSYLLATMAVLPTMLFLARGSTKAFTKSIGLVSFIGMTIIVAALLTGGGIKKINDLLDSFIFSGIDELVTQSGGALIGRKVVSLEKEEFIKKNPLFGYGFIDKDSKFGKELGGQIRGETLGFIDRGMLDVLLKFGYIGTMVFFAAVVYMFIILRRIAKNNKGSMLEVRALTIASMLVVFILVQPVHAPLTYSFALLPLGIALGLIEREQHIVDALTIIDRRY